MHVCCSFTLKFLMAVYEKTEVGKNCSKKYYELLFVRRIRWLGLFDILDFLVEILAGLASLYICVRLRLFFCFVFDIGIK